jgi:hypothetical protein
LVWIIVLIRNRKLEIGNPKQTLFDRLSFSIESTSFKELVSILSQIGTYVPGILFTFRRSAVGTIIVFILPRVETRGYKIGRPAGTGGRGV